MRILDANDKAMEEGYQDAYERLRSMLNKYRIKEKIGKVPPVSAIVNHGRWVAVCPDCEGVEYVAEGVPFMCFSCGNEKYDHLLRSVTFPRNRKDIEEELLRREMSEGVGQTDTHRAMRRKPKKSFLYHSWMPGESVEELKRQREMGYDAYVKSKKTIKKKKVGK